MKSKIGLNVIANLIGKIWSILSIYIFVPLWIRYLGIEGYGVVTFYTVLLTILVFADAGLTATLVREYAKSNLSVIYKRNLLHTIEFIYLFICLFIFIGTYFSADFIVSKFLKTENISIDKLVHSVQLMGAIIAVYFLYSLYQGGLMGLQKQIANNVLNSLYGLMRSGIVIIPLIFYPDILTFLLWQLISTFVFCLLSRYILCKTLSSNKPPVIHFSYLRLIWGYAVGMMILSIIASLNTQMDKLLVGHLLTLSDFSKYSLASTVGQVILMASLPIGLAFYPELTKLISSGDENKTKILFHKFSFIVASVASSITFVVVLFCSSYIYIWTHDLEIAKTIATPAIILVIANLFVALQYGPYFLALSNGHTRTNIILGILFVICLIILLVNLTPIYGINGAAVPFLLINMATFIILGILIIKKYLRTEFWTWLLFDSLLPVFANLIISLLLYSFFRRMPQGYYTLLYGFIILLTTLSFSGGYFLKRYPEYRYNKKNIFG